MPDSPRILELRRRVQMDPASIAFAQLAEECRRNGSNEEAIEICRAGLARNPGYLSARVTLGRALIELGQLDAAKAELDVVVAGVPDNLAAIRGLAEILQRRGQMKEALEYYKRALELARHDPDLEDTVERISQEVAPAPPAPPAGPQVSIEEIFNFDTLIDQLGLGPLAPTAVSASAAEGGFGETSAEIPVAELASAAIDDLLSISASAPAVEDFFGDLVERPEEVPELSDEQAPVADTVSASTEVEDFFAAIPAEPVVEAPVFAIEASPELASETPASEGVPLESIALELDDADALAVMERQLRELEERRVQDEQRARRALAQRRRNAMIRALETWLSAIVADRERHSA